MTLKVAIVGCGKIADQHLQQILRIADTQVVAVCDAERLMAQQLQDRFPIGAHYVDVNEMLAAERPDVVHITTPPGSHFELARRCLMSGSHVYVEKPFTVDHLQAEELVRVAVASGRKLTVGHNVQFTDPAIQMRRLVADGYLGGRPSHMESHYGYDLGDVRYVTAIFGDKNHWVRTLPGKLFHNIISHGIAKVAEFMPGDDPEIMSCAFVSTPLRRAGEADVPDELRVMIRDVATGVTAYFTFSTTMRPLLHQFKVYGPTNGLLTDDDHLLIVKLRGTKYKSYLDNIIPPLSFAKQYLASGLSNARKLIGQDLFNDAGMKSLIKAFYTAIRSDGPPPIPYREILLTARIMDKIFATLPSPQSPEALLPAAAPSHETFAT